MYLQSAKNKLVTKLFFVGLFKATAEKSRIRTPNQEVGLLGSGSLKLHGSETLIMPN
jgi:hypothetical protein